MERAVEVAKQMIEKTRREIREDERKQEVIQKFEDLFGFPPENVCWDEDLLRANYIVNFDDFDDEVPTIMEKPVKKVSFGLVEEKIDLGYDLDWNFRKLKEKDLIMYKWTRKLRKFVAVIRIVIERNK